MRKINRPALVAMVAGTVLALAGACEPHGKPTDPCAPDGCKVPTSHQAVPVASCLDTGERGPCAVWTRGSDNLCHWWYVTEGATLAGDPNLDEVIDLGTDETMCA